MPKVLTASRVRVPAHNEAEYLATPGHTPACGSYKIGDNIFVGDTLFMHDYGTARCDFPGGDARTMYRSIRRILDHHPQTVLWVCHDYKAPGRDEYAWRTTVGAEREQNPQRVRDRFFVDDTVGRALRADETGRRRAGRFRRAQAVGMHRRDGGGAGQNEPERLGQAGHGGGGAHDRAGAGGDGELPLDLRDLRGLDVAGAIARPEAPAVGAGAEPLAAMARGRHRPADQRDRRQIGRGGGHQLRRHGLVATAHEHDRIHRLGADHLLGVERHQVAELEAGR